MTVGGLGVGVPEKKIVEFPPSQKEVNKALLWKGFKIGVIAIGVTGAVAAVALGAFSAVTVAYLAIPIFISVSIFSSYYLMPPIKERPEWALLNHAGPEPKLGGMTDPFIRKKIREGLYFDESFSAGIRNREIRNLGEFLHKNERYFFLMKMIKESEASKPRNTEGGILVKTLPLWEPEDIPQGYSIYHLFEGMDSGGRLAGKHVHLGPILVSKNSSKPVLMYNRSTQTQLGKNEGLVFKLPSDIGTSSDTGYDAFSLSEKLVIETVSLRV